MYKLIAIDLDGTLLNSYGIISDENKNAIKKAKEKGIEVVLTSGRMSSSVVELADEVGANNYIISGNGAIVYDLINNKILYNECITKDKVLKIIKICEENNIYYTINTEKYILSKKLKNNALYYYYENSKKSESKITNINIVEDVEKYIIENDVGQVTKITISDEDKIIFNGIIKKLKLIKGINILEVSSMSKKIIKSGTKLNEINYFYTEITKENINKWETIKKLASDLKIDKSDIATIGDNINDLEMIQNAGLGIIIGNSALSKKGLNNVIVSSNDSNRSCRSNRKIYTSKTITLQ